MKTLVGLPLLQMKSAKGGPGKPASSSDLCTAAAGNLSCTYVAGSQFMSPHMQVQHG